MCGSRPPKTKDPTRRSATLRTLMSPEPVKSPPEAGPHPRDWLADILWDPSDERPATLDAEGVCFSGDTVIGRNVGGVLRFVPDDDYAENFGLQWRWFPRTQLDASDSSIEPSRES